jgi:ABC-type transport system involved in multi-copper enzyme maturation permease subunit
MTVLLSEWTKFRSLRSTYVTLLIAAVTALGGSAIITFSQTQANQAAPFDPVAGIFIGWVFYPVLAIGILGVLTLTAEFSTGQIRLTFSAVPRRVTVLAAKAAVAGLAGLVLGEVLAFAALGIALVVSAGHPQETGLSGASIHVLAGGLSMCVAVLLGVGLGGIIRHTAGAIVALPAVLYLPLLVFALPAPWNDRIGRFTPMASAYQLVTSHPSSQLFSPGLSLLVLIAWPAAALAAAAVVLTRRDA